MEGEMELFSLQPILDSNELAELSKVFADEMDIFNRNQLIINTITKIDFRKFGELTEEMESNINRNIDYLYYMDYVQFDLETGKSPTGKTLLPRHKPIGQTIIISLFDRHRA